MAFGSPAATVTMSSQLAAGFVHLEDLALDGAAFGAVGAFDEGARRRLEYSKRWSRCGMYGFFAVGVMTAPAAGDQTSSQVVGFWQATGMLRVLPR